MAQAKETPVESGKQILSMKERIAQRLANVDKTTAAPSSNKISTNGGKFALPTGESSPGPLNCIVIDYTNANAYYEGAYDPNNIQPPVCYAVSKNIDTMAPPQDLETKVSDQCDGCPNNEFGSAGRGKACKNNAVLAIIPESFNDGDDVLTIKVSPTGLKTWSGYVRQLSNRGMDVSEVVTSISFRTGVTYPTLDFKALDAHGKIDDLTQFVDAADILLASSATAQ